MTKAIVIFLLSSIRFSLSAQTFEGEITYKNTFKSKLANVSNEQWASMLGATQNYLIKDGNYRSNTNGTVVLWQLYINNDNKLYTKVSNSESVLWYDGADNPDTVLAAELKKDAVDILGYKCHELILTCKSGIQKYYYAESLKVDPALFDKHKYGNWSEFISRSKSLPLKIIIENAQFILESLAVDVKQIKLDTALFALPSGTKTTKAPN